MCVRVCYFNLYYEWDSFLLYLHCSLLLGQHSQCVRVRVCYYYVWDSFLLYLHYSLLLGQHSQCVRVCYYVWDSFLRCCYEAWYDMIGTSDIPSTFLRTPGADENVNILLTFPVFTCIVNSQCTRRHVRSVDSYSDAVQCWDSISFFFVLLLLSYFWQLLLFMAS